MIINVSGIKHVSVFSAGLHDGCIVAEVSNPAVSDSILEEIMQWKERGAGENEIYHNLRCRTVPPGYPYHTWKPGKQLYRTCSFCLLATI